MTVKPLNLRSTCSGILIFAPGSVGIIETALAYCTSWCGIVQSWAPTQKVPYDGMRRAALKSALTPFHVPPNH